MTKPKRRNVIDFEPTQAVREARKRPHVITNERGYMLAAANGKQCHGVVSSMYSGEPRVFPD